MIIRPYRIRCLQLILLVMSQDNVLYLNKADRAMA